jgi:YHS domain-containing protein
MTAQRRDLIGRGCAAMLAMLAILPMMSACGAATTERVVSDRYTGLAIGGFDPVAYFTDAQPVRGDPDYELSASGVVWRFSNEGNRTEFAAHPEVYGPQFGGYDPVDVARGVAYAGNPRYWLVSGRRLYLFGRPDSRDAFAAAPAGYVAEALKRWPAVQDKLAQ